MKIAGSILIAAIALSSPSFAQVRHPVVVAGAGDAPEVIPRVVVPSRRFHVEPQDFAYYEFAYPLSNGEIVKFSRRVGRFYITIRGYERVEILASSRAQFVTKGGATLTFTEDGDALTIDNYERLLAESGPPIVYAFGDSK